MLRLAVTITLQHVAPHTSEFSHKRGYANACAPHGCRQQHAPVAQRGSVSDATLTGPEATRGDIAQLRQSKEPEGKFNQYEWMYTDSVRETCSRRFPQIDFAGVAP